MEKDGKPTLWHIPISHYSEKVRWALGYKGVEHHRRAPQPPSHMVAALALTRGRHKTFPVLQLDGEAIGDSTAIIAALERRFPDPPLYPQAEDERRRALELEEWFDEQLGPDMRLLAWHEITRDQARLEYLTARGLPRPLRRLAAGPLVLPPEGPQLPDPPEALERFRAPLKERPGYRWVEEMFRRHRRSPDT